MAVAAAVSLLGWWSMTGRGSEPHTPDADAGAGALGLEILAADGSVPLTDGSVPLMAQDPNPKPVVDGVVQPRYEGVILGGGDGGMFATEQPPPDYVGEVTEVIDFEPEIEPPVVGPDVEVFTEAQLAERRRGQVEVIGQRIETLSARIGRARDQGNETMVHLLEMRRRRLQQRRDTLAEM